MSTGSASHSLCSCAREVDYLVLRRMKETKTTASTKEGLYTPHRMSHVIYTGQPPNRVGKIYPEIILWEIYGVRGQGLGVGPV
jgi:hypothetical protein